VHQSQSAGSPYTYIMSASPAKETEVEQGDPSPENSDHNMDRGDVDAQARDLTFEFEVKEQDRWLPIANGWFSMHCQLPISFAGLQRALQQETLLRLVPLMTCVPKGHTAAILLSTGLLLCNLKICTSIPPLSSLWFMSPQPLRARKKNVPQFPAIHFT
jgi:hypothetical protein